MTAQSLATEKANAERIEKHFRGRLIWTEGRGWLAWNGKHWAAGAGSTKQVFEELSCIIAAEAAECRTLAKQNNDEVLAEKSELLWKWAVKSEGANTHYQSLKLAQDLLSKPEDRIDAELDLLAVQNGVVDLRTGELLRHDPRNLQTKICQADYDPDGQCPRWDKFISEIFSGDTDLCEWIQRMIGYSATGRTEATAFFMLLGRGANGKSVLLNTVARILGTYAEYCPTELFVRARQSYGTPPYALADLAGVRLVIAPETGRGQAMDEPMVRRWTGGEPHKARQIYGKPFIYTPQGKLWFMTNERPVIRETHDATWRRMRLVNMREKFPIDGNLLNVLWSEREGILRWILKGAYNYYQSGAATCHHVDVATSEYKRDEDAVGVFVEECCVPEGTVSVGVLYDAFEDWGGHQPGGYTKITFGKEIARRGFRKVRLADGLFWRGLKL